MGRRFVFEVLASGLPAVEAMQPVLAEAYFAVATVHTLLPIYLYCVQLYTFVPPYL